MMISPDIYREENQNKTYGELLNEKSKLLKEIGNFENNINSNSKYLIEPSPAVVYQCNLEYLSELCILIKEKFNKELWGKEND